MAGYEVGSAYLSILPSTKGMSGLLARELDGPFSAAGRRGGGLMGAGLESGGRSGFMAAGGILGKLFIGAFAAIGASQVISVATQWISDAVGMASDLEQSVGGVDAVFKDNAETIHDWAEGAADALGLSQSSYNELATVIGAQLKNMGIPLDEATEKTGLLIGIGADLAAQFGGSTSDAVSALSSLLRGERDPIEKYGVSINDARIQAELAEQGLGDLEGEAKKTAETQAVLKLLTEQTADAQGAFGREADTAAGQQARLKAELENVQTEIGTALLPILVDLTDIFVEDVLPIVQEFADWVTENKEEIRELGLFLIEMGLSGLEATLRLAEGLAMYYDVGVTVFDNVSRLMLDFVSTLLDAAAQAFGWVPEIGPKLQTAQDDFADFKSDAVNSLDAARASADLITDSLGSAADEVGGLRDSIKNLDGSKATFTLAVNDQGGLLNYYGGRFDQMKLDFTGGTSRRRAGGGPVTAGEPYIVGEYEPELFVPDRSGVIYNQKQLASMAGAGGGREVVQNNYYSGIDPEAAAAATDARLRSAMAGRPA